MDSPPPPPVGSRAPARMVIVAVATLLGAGGGWWVFGRSPLILVGVLIGFLVGRTFVDLGSPEAGGSGAPRILPNAVWSVILGVGGWLAALGSWAYFLSGGFFRGEGASLLLVLVVLPVTVICGLVGGPLASTAARRALKQIETGERPQGDQFLARIGLVLGHLMSLALLAFLAWLLISFWS